VARADSSVDETRVAGASPARATLAEILHEVVERNAEFFLRRRLLDPVPDVVA
jgi:hypothetical protein